MDRIVFSSLDALLEQAVQRVCPAAQLAIRQHGESIYSRAFGFLDLDAHRHPTRLDSTFDLASVTKLFTTAAFMTLVEAGEISLDLPVCTVLPEFSGSRPIQPYENPLDWGKYVTVPAALETETVDASAVTFRHLLIHNSGLPAWRPFKDQPDAASARKLALETFFSYPMGERIVYSDVGLILLGMSIERLTDLPLDAVIRTRVTEPLGLTLTRFLPITGSQSDQPAALPLDNIAPTEFCKWRNRRIVGEVHDESAARLGGVAGHAGLFSCAAEVAKFGQLFLDGGRPLLQPATVKEMTRLQAEFNGTRRGIGFSLWSPDPEASSNPFSPLTFGHTGFTGTCVWMDPQRDLVVAFLTNEVYNGREGRGIGPLRVDVHRTILSILEQEQPA